MVQRKSNRQMKIIFIISLVILFSEVTASADDGYVVKTFSGCDYFIADGPKGLYVLEWFGGYDPSEGDTISGDIGSFGIKDVIYNGSSDGRVWVEDFLESSSQALEEIRNHCG